MVIKFIDSFLNKITMYRLVLYCLVFLWVVGLIISFLNVIPFEPLDLIISSAIIYASCIIANIVFEKIFRAPSNPESTYITALILSLVVGPEKTVSGYFLLVILSLMAISSKYLLAFKKKHIFNPAAFGIVISTYAINYYPSWWIGDINMIWPVLAVGLLMARKLQRFDMVLSFFLVYIITSIGSLTSLQHFSTSFNNLFAYSPVLFFAFIMLTEPSTTPPTRILRIIYGSLVALLMAPFIHIGAIYFSPELALLAGNAFSFLVSPKIKLLLTLKEKKEIAKNTYEFIFSKDKNLSFKAGQYMEWTLKHSKYDDRGTRRYFTLASSPTEDLIKIGIKFYEKPSSFKKILFKLNPGEQVVASQLSGEFTLPKNKQKKLVFLAGGIGVTPFRSMIKNIIDNNERRDIVVFYAANSYDDIAYKDIFDEAERKFDIKVIYVLKDAAGVPPGLNYELDIIDEKMIKRNVKDFRERLFYISGPRSMITAFEKTLHGMKVSKFKIKTDFFPGYA